MRSSGFRGDALSRMRRARARDPRATGPVHRPWVNTESVKVEAGDAESALGRGRKMRRLLAL